MQEKLEESEALKCKRVTQTVAKPFHILRKFIFFEYFSFLLKCNIANRW